MLLLVLAWLGAWLSLTDAANFRIVGGTDAAEGGAPYQCSMQRGKASDHFCGCAILSEKWIVTAAHCIDSTMPEAITILIGTNDKKKGGKRHKVEKLIPHRAYKYRMSGGDIGLIRVKESIEFNTLVQPIEYTKEPVQLGSILYLTGWGQSGAWGGSPNKLQAINLTSISFDECEEMYSRINEKVPSGVLCTLNQRGEGACFGDSGGPLTFDGKLVGIVSFGVPCAVGMPDAFSEISYYYDWIRDTIKANSIG